MCSHYFSYQTVLLLRSSSLKENSFSGLDYTTASLPLPFYLKTLFIFVTSDHVVCNDFCMHPSEKKGSKLI